MSVCLSVRVSVHQVAVIQCPACPVDIVKFASLCEKPMLKMSEPDYLFLPGEADQKDLKCMDGCCVEFCLQQKTADLPNDRPLCGDMYWWVRMCLVPHYDCV